MNTIQNRKTRSLMAALQLACAAAVAGTETANWTGAGGDGVWETAANWDTGTVPSAGTDVIFSSSPRPTVQATTELPTIASLFVMGAGVTLSLDPNAALRTSGPVTNRNTTTYSGGSYAFGGELVVGWLKAWSGDSTYTTRTRFEDCRADIAGRVYVTGTENNGLDVTNAYVKSAGYLDANGTRNQTKIGADGVFVSTGDIEISNCWPNDQYSEPLTVDGGTVTNAGRLLVAKTNAGRVPICLRNGATWVQTGETQVGINSDSSSNSLQVVAGSRFLSSGNIRLACGNRVADSFLAVDGSSALEAANVSVGSAYGAKGCRMTVTDQSSATVTQLTLGGADQNSGMSLVVAGGSSLTAERLVAGNTRSSSDDLSIAVSNASLSVTAGSVSLPAGVTSGRVAFTLVGTSEAPATADFAGGLVIGAASGGSDATVLRTSPTVFTVDGGTVTCGAVGSDGTTSGDVRLGGYNVGGVQDLATNRLEIAGSGGCFVARHRMMAAGTPEVRFAVPDGGYQGAHGCGLYGQHFYLNAARFVVDVTQVETDGTFSLAQATGTLEIDEAKVSVVARDDQRVKIRYQNTVAGRFLSATVKKRRGLLLIFK